MRYYLGVRHQYLCVLFSCKGTVICDDQLIRRFNVFTCYSIIKVSDVSSRVLHATEKAEQGIQLAELYYSTLNNKISKLEQNLKANSDQGEIRDQMINELQAKMWNGNFVWKITDFEQLFQQAASGEVPAIHSAPFYSGIPGLFSAEFGFLFCYCQYTRFFFLGLSKWFLQPGSRIVVEGR